MEEPGNDAAICPETSPYGLTVSKLDRAAWHISPCCCCCGGGGMPE